MSWHPRPEDHVFNRVLRVQFRRGWWYGFLFGVSACTCIFYLVLRGLL